MSQVKQESFFQKISSPWKKNSTKTFAACSLSMMAAVVAFKFPMVLGLVLAVASPIILYLLRGAIKFFGLEKSQNFVNNVIKKGKEKIKEKVPQQYQIIADYAFDGIQNFVDQFFEDIKATEGDSSWIDNFKKKFIKWTLIIFLILIIFVVILIVLLKYLFGFIYWCFVKLFRLFF